ncbi:DNA polymerase lambda isoform X1 [Ambystoma mexicanum]|uniref:DNA polymerase lambda isoform X1 n=1 Tax=Ambystoma mexicanum TaxID=8296 RepID=UPI0037E96C73
MELGGIIKAFPKVKRKQESLQKVDQQKKLKEEDVVKDDWLKPLTVYVIQAGIGRARTEIFQKQVIQNGGKVCSSFSSEVTHIIVDEGMDCDRAFRILKVDKIPPETQLVKSAWLSLCIKENKMVDTTGYRIFISDRYLDEGDQVKNEHRAPPSKKTQPKTSDETEEPTIEIQKNLICTAEQNTDPQKPNAKHTLFASQVSEDEGSEEEDPSVTQGDLNALLLGQVPTSSSSDTSTATTGHSISENWVCSQSSERKNQNHNKSITDKLEVLAKAYTVQGDRWRALGYTKAINALKSFHKPVTTYQEACTIRGIGKKMAEKIEEILESGHLRKIDHIDESVGVMEIFSNIWGAGVKTAQMWYQQGFRTLDDIRTKANLTSQQVIGLKYYEDLLDRMPREEAAEIEQTVREVALSINPGLLSVACGSFRRGKLTCGDVDVLVTHPDGKSHKGVFGKLIDGLKAQGFLTDDLVSHEDSGTQKKYMGVCCLPGPGRKHRRLDVIVVPYSEFACSLMYFTGSAHFNRSMRALAKTKSMSLSEHSLNRDVVRNGTLKVSTGFALPTRSEKDVFELLGLPFREPHERDW